MASPSPEGVDSRTSTIGRKHTLDDPEVVDGGGSDEYPDKNRKRMRQSSIEDDLLSTVYANSENRTPSNSHDIDQIAANVPAPPSNIENRATSPKPTEVSSAVPSQISWNQGVQGGIRTSFGSRGSPLLLQPKALSTSSNITEDSSLPKTVSSGQKDTSHEDPSKTKQSKKKKTKGNKKNTRIAQPADNLEPIQSLPGKPGRAALLLAEFAKFADILPQKVTGKVFKYDKVAWNISPMSSDAESGLPLGKLSFERGFLPQFIEANQTHIDRLNTVCVKQAFLAHLRSYYNHHKATKHFKHYLRNEEVNTFIEKTIAETKSRHSEQHPKIEDSDSLEGTSKESGHPDSPEDFASTSEESEEGAIPPDEEISMDVDLAAPGGIVDEPRISAPGEELEHPMADDTKGLPVEHSASSDAEGGHLLVSNTTVSNGTGADTHHGQIGMDSREIAAVERYFPGLPDVSSRATCLTCSQRGHKSLECPRLTCRSCGMRGAHFAEACPQTQRCTKCRKLGHQKTACPEKLAAISGESEPCNLCKVANHAESVCPLVWRTYKPSIFSVTKVQDLPITCYSCGSDGHFGPDCGLRRSGLLTGGSTWSQTNRNQYIEASSSMRALSAGKDFTIPPRVERSINIKGRSHRDQDIIDSESDDGEFIRAKINVPSRSQGHIRLNTGRGPSVRSNAPSVKESFPNSRPPRGPQSKMPPGPRRSNDTANDRRDNYYGRYARERTFSPPPRYPDEGRFQEPVSQRSRGNGRRRPPRSDSRGGRRR